MIQPLLKERIRPVIQRIRLRRTMLAMATVWTVAAVVVIVMYLVGQNTETSFRHYWPIILGVTGLSSLAASIWGWVSGGNIDKVVQRIESQFPDLDSALLTAVQLEPDPGSRTLTFLQQDVVRRAVFHSYDHSWPSVVKIGQLVLSPLANLTSLVTFAAAVLTLMLYRPPVNENAVAFDDVEINGNPQYELTVVPGDTEVEKGTSLLVLARFGESLPPEVSVFTETQDGSRREYLMNKSLDDPVFGARITSVDSPMQYWVNYGDTQSPRFQVNVFEYPTLLRCDARIEYPEYTHLEDKQVQDVRRVSAVQGSDVHLTFHLNQPVEVATLVSEAGEQIPLENDPSVENRLTTTLSLSETGRQTYRLELINFQQRRNQDPPQLVINTLENRDPKIKLTAPSGDIQVSALEEISIQGESWDDFGIQRMGLSYTLGDQPEKQVELPLADSKKKQVVNYVLALEELNAKPDEFLTYYLWAEDIGPDGATRVISSDVYFAEIRPFDEIYRQAAAQPQGQPQQSSDSQGQNGQNAQQAQQLAELQKQIITATWNLIRREDENSPTPEFRDDVEVLAESQGQALQQLQQLAQNVTDDRSKSIVDETGSLMNGAMVHFQQAQVDQLEAAFQDAKGAYQGLLRLRSREHQVQRQQQQQQQQQSSQSNAQQQRQQQLNQMELEEDQNPYQQEKQIQEQTEQEQQQQENRQILSRLRELARRQNDLNKKMKELQSALEEAESEEEKEEIRRELERLREQQQEILRDAEELQQRMDESENPESMQEQSQKMEEARENARRASEALEQGQVSRASAEGQRTKEQLEELRDEFQNRTSGQFSEQMRQMRNEAQDIEQAQNELRERLDDLDSPAENDRSLRADDSRETIAEELADQRQRVSELREEIKQTIEEAEPYEPLLAEELYDTYRESEQQRLDQALETTERSVRRGLMDDARMVEDMANRGIQNLREGIEQAAESVLGDETQALENARDAVNQLRQELENEIQENSPEEPDSESQQDSENQQQSGRSNQSSDADQNSQRRNQSPSEQDSESENREGGNQQGQPNNSQSENSQDSNSDSPAEDQPGSQGSRDQQERSQSRDANQRQQRGQAGLRDRGNNAPNVAQGTQENRGPQGDPNYNDRDAAPLTGEDFLDWSDRLRDVEEMVNDPDLRGEASRIRDRAKQIRKDFKRHSKDPNWNLVEMQIAQPLQELQRRLTEELIRRSNRNAIVPLDRDPIPGQYQDAMDRYYRELGTGQ